MAEKRYHMHRTFGDNPPMFAQRLDDVPHCRALSMAAVHAGPCEATVRIPFDRKLVGDPTRGIVSGGPLDRIAKSDVVESRGLSLAARSIPYHCPMVAKPGIVLDGAVVVHTAPALDNLPLASPAATWGNPYVDWLTAPV